MTLPEHNVTGHDYTQRAHLTYRGPIIDIHSHVMLTRPGDPPAGPPLGEGPGASLDQAATMLRRAADFGIVHTVTMCLPDDITPLREKFGNQIGFNGSIAKKNQDEPDEAAFRLLDRFLGLGVKIIKFWSAPRGRDRGLFVDAPWRIECAKRARDAGIRLMMVHVADPDAWFTGVYSDQEKYGSKPDQYVGLEKMLSLFPDLVWIGAHMGGDPENPDHLEALLEQYPHFYLDTSATKWQIREVSPRSERIHALICKFPDRFLFGSDLVTRHGLPTEHYVSRYWCQRTLWESSWQGRSPIADPDYQRKESGSPTPLLQGVGLPPEVLEMVYYQNAQRLLNWNDNTL